MTREEYLKEGERLDSLQRDGYEIIQHPYYSAHLVPDHGGLVHPLVVLDLFVRYS